MMLTEGGTMQIDEHYAISSKRPYALAGQDCCRWHHKMQPELAESRKEWTSLSNDGSYGAWQRFKKEHSNGK